MWRSWFVESVIYWHSGAGSYTCQISMRIRTGVHRRYRIISWFRGTCVIWKALTPYIRGQGTHVQEYIYIEKKESKQRSWLETGCSIYLCTSNQRKLAASMYSNHLVVCETSYKLTLSPSPLLLLFKFNTMPSALWLALHFQRNIIKSWPGQCDYIPANFSCCTVH